MLIKDLTNEQIRIIADNNPNWMANNRPEWMADNRPEWMTNNRPEYMMKYNSIELPAEIEALIK